VSFVRLVRLARTRQSVESAGYVNFRDEAARDAWRQALPGWNGVSEIGSDFSIALLWQGGRSPSTLANAHDLNELARREVLERRYSAKRPLRLNIAHDLVGDFADDRDIARVPRLRPTVLRLHARHADHRDDLKDHWFIILFIKTRPWWAQNFPAPIDAAIPTLTVIEDPRRKLAMSRR
jgi:hypothetical protein